MLDTTRAVMRTDPCRIALLLELSGAQEQVHCPDHLGSKLSLSFNSASYILLIIFYSSARNVGEVRESLVVANMLLPQTSHYRSVSYMSVSK